eukprot:NODE_755_length_1217_cov_104.701835_g715_i0.p1 GENE.NODE_755_length_1217_cov_104.701835_g715_i0~~NODE_755_length_1217_cov_104.701835_g715_i0.p1  ORF type:complete len:376 (+),score=34.53 NODE_755_length_1217_cov_104.701835_g715_i0:69-1196(+)
MADYLESLATTVPSNLQAAVVELRDHLQKLWWHELTLGSLQLLPQIDEAERRKYWENVLLPNAKKLNPLKLAQLGVTCSPSETDPRIKFLQDLVENLQGQAEPTIIVQCELALCALAAGDPKKCKETLRECEASLNKQEAHELNPDTHVSFYRSQAKYRESAKEWTEHYEAVLSYIVWCDLQALPESEIQQLALSVGVSALIGQRIYNFGELLNTSVMQSLHSSSSYGWLEKLLVAFNAGDIQAFEAITAEHGSSMASLPELASHAEFLKEKVRLMAFLAHLFTLKESHRVVPFADVARVTHTPVEQVEFMLLRALALGLIKGTIDEVAQTCTVTWVQARVLSIDEVKHLRDKVDQWQKRVVELAETSKSVAAFE